MAQLAIIGFRAELDAHGALSFVNANPERRDFARMCPTAYCFAVVNAALDVDRGFVAVAVSCPSKKQRIARAGPRPLRRGRMGRESGVPRLEQARIVCASRALVPHRSVWGCLARRRAAGDQRDGGCDRDRNGARRPSQILSEGDVMLGNSYSTRRTLAGNMTEPGQPDGARPDAAETCRVMWGSTLITSPGAPSAVSTFEAATRSPRLHPGGQRFESLSSTTTQYARSSPR
jgi:hypothetical protein